MTQPVPATSAPYSHAIATTEVSGAASASRLIAAGETLLKSLLVGKALDHTAIRNVMTAAFEGTDSEGKWLWKDAYEACEVAQLLFLRKHITAMRRGAQSQLQLLGMLDKVEALLPTHTRRSEESQSLQQFSTPLFLAMLAADAAAITEGDLVLEPSAGTGQLAVHAEAAGAALHLNEWADTRAGILQGLFPAAGHSQHNAEHIHDLLAHTVEPTVVLMNPPFSQSPHINDPLGGIDLKHLKSALHRLAPGGRLVAITSYGLHRYNPRYGDAFAALSDIATLRYSTGLWGRFFKKHGTTIITRLTVFDKVPDDGIKPVFQPAETMTPLSLMADVAALPSRAKLAIAALATRTLRPSRPIIATTAPIKAFVPSPAPAAEPIGYDIIDTAPTVSKGDALYEPYSPERIRITGAKPHPSKLVQSAAMASVRPPPPTYRPMLPTAVVSDGLLSDAQLESVIYAGEAHSRYLAGHWLVDEHRNSLSAAAHDDPKAVQFRRGWFLGDGTGAGKGRQVAGIVLDNWIQSRRKALWISKSDKLLEDAQRDWSALQQEKLLIVPQSRFKQGKPIKLPEGILFTTYATLRSAEREGKASRLEQVLQWVGDDFDGVIVFDEAHAMGNAAGGMSERGARAPSQQGLAGLALQHALPNARVVYVSATGATTVDNLAYAQRLGLWGSDDLPFETRSSFVAAMHEGGIASSEVLARDLKALGLYMARALSYEGVEVEMLDHALTPDQISIYDEYANAYQIIHHNLEAAMQATGITSEEHGTLSKAAKSAARSAFEGNKLRFFGHLITAMSMPSLITAIEDDQAGGRASVVQLVSTSEALMERRLAEVPPSQWNDLSFDVTPREYVLDYLHHSFPTQLFETFEDDDGNLQSKPLYIDGRPVECREAAAKRDALIERLAALPPVQAALDQLVHHFGADAVAEVTGRSRRIVKKRAAHGDVLAVQNRPQSSNIGETQAFMDDMKRILVFSDAGGTGRSYHADLGAMNQRRRIHYLLESGWKADTAIQGLGRTNRTNQKQPPVFRPVTTSVRAQKRFISTIARRLDSLGAITRGHRDTGGQGLFRAADNLESVYARAALRHFYKLIHTNKVACAPLLDFEAATGLSLSDADGTLREDLPPMSTFLNRLLALPIGLQNQLFEVFEGLIEARVDEAVTAGTYDVGLETITAESLAIATRRVIATHAATGSETELLEIRRKDKNTPLSLAAAQKRAADEPQAVMLANLRSNRAALRVPTFSLTLEDGTVERRVRLLRPMEHHAMPVAAMQDTHWEPCDADTFARLWNHEIAQVPEHTTTSFHVIAGLLLPIWKALPFANPRIFRFTTDDGVSVIGRVVTIADMQAFQTADMNIKTPEQAWHHALDGVPVPLPGGMALKRVLVMHHPRIELTGFHHDAVPRLKAMGCYSELIAWKLRLFVPISDEGQAVVARLMARNALSPATGLQEGNMP